jgi:hypothetical protein
VLERLLTEAPDYSWEGRVVSYNDGLAIVEGTLKIATKYAFGVGAMKNPDADMAVKSANSEAIKNAAKNGFGIALELWDEGHRDDLARRREILKSEQSMKLEVFRIAKEKFTGEGSPKVQDVADIFGVEPGDLSDKAKLKEILEAEGVL